MNTQQIEQILLAYGISLTAQQLTATVIALKITTPGITDTTLLSTEDGTIKHLIRTKIGFFVDLIWGAIEPYIDQAITAAIAQADAQAAATTTVNPQ